jgi:excisionase family DNA binding protein
MIAVAFDGRFSHFAVSKHMNQAQQQPTDEGGVPESLSASDALLTAEEVAALLQVTCSWVYAQTRRRRIPHLRLGRYVRYRREALDAWMKHVELTSTSSASSRARSRAVR